MADVTCLKGPLEIDDGELVLLIPLEEGGDQFINYTRGIGEVRDQSLRIVIREWLAKMLNLHAGDFVTVDNANGKFNIHPSADRQE